MRLPSYSCVLCNDDVEETVEHLFFECTFSVWCWRLMGITWDFTAPIPKRLALCGQASRSPVFMDVAYAQDLEAQAGAVDSGHSQCRNHYSFYGH